VENRNNIIIYTDGACKGNPGPGGWGVFIKNLKRIDIELSGFESLTTNNRMEIKAAIMGLKYFEEKTTISLFTDSNYLKLGITDWINKWKMNSWKTSNKKEVKNKDLWIELEKLASFHNVEWNWVKAHDGNIGNEKADELACSAIDKNLK
tara:strand:- start:70 stop:519 length:450 start_codon:yes stop_codon:yes gene_type:complete